MASCLPIPRPRAHAPNKQGGKPAGQDTSSYAEAVRLIEVSLYYLLSIQFKFKGSEWNTQTFEMKPLKQFFIR